MAASYELVKYKISTMQSFLTRNLVDLGYDGDRESKNRGPFRSTAGLTKAAGIRAHDFVLDLAAAPAWCQGKWRGGLLLWAWL